MKKLCSVMPLKVIRNIFSLRSSEIKCHSVLASALAGSSAKNFIMKQIFEVFMSQIYLYISNKKLV